MKVSRVEPISKNRPMGDKKEQEQGYAGRSAFLDRIKASAKAENTIKFPDINPSPLEPREISPIELYRHQRIQDQMEMSSKEE